MHEIGLASGIVRMVELAAIREHFSHVASLRLEAGCLAGIEPEALRFALLSMAPGTCLAGAEIKVEAQPGSAWCRHCGHTVAISNRAQPCPDCGGFTLHVTGGTELRVGDLIVYAENLDTAAMAGRSPCA